MAFTTPPFRLLRLRLRSSTTFRLKSEIVGCEAEQFVPRSASIFSVTLGQSADAVRGPHQRKRSDASNISFACRQSLLDLISPHWELRHCRKIPDAITPVASPKLLLLVGLLLRLEKLPNRIHEGSFLVLCQM